MGVGVFFLAGWLIQLIWNATITVIFESNPVTYWQGILLLILFKFLIGGQFDLHQKKGKKVASHAQSIHAKFSKDNEEQEKEVEIET